MKQELAEGHPRTQAHSSPRVIRYDDRYRTDFRDLNLAWIEKYFEVEEPDRIAFDDPLQQIIRPGGEIFFVMDHEQVQGTCALVRHDAEHYELAKMAVAPRAQGRGYGNLLIEAVIQEAKRKGARQLSLLSNTILVPAMKLYEKHGFRTTHLGPHTEYKRANIKMVLDLTP